MAETGVLEPDARVELVDGEIVDMGPIGAPPSSAVNRVQLLLFETLGRRAVVLGQSALRLGDASEPQPDLMVLKPRADFYAATLPSVDDLLLVVEVSDATLKYDTGLKAALYTSHGVADYWVVDVVGARLLRHRDPLGEVYRQVVAEHRPGPTPVPGLDGSMVDLRELF